ncbi:MAG: DUF3987 domain-containing protein [Acidimicrobiales bacterium]
MTAYAPLTLSNTSLLAPPGWPDPPDSDAYVGLPGAIVEAIAPHTEADPVAILGQLLVAAGSVIGRGAFFEVEATRHHPNEFVVLVGESAKARKGSSWDHVAALMAVADAGFAARTSTGLSSGEGLIWALRDPAGADRGNPAGRLLVLEPEFATVLKAVGRDQNTLSPVLRSAWDGRPLALLTRTAPAKASAAHLAIVGHITAVELAHHLSGLEIANGLLNRFLLLAVRRVRLLPEGGHPDPLAGTGLPAELAANLATARNAGRLRFNPKARKAWWENYPRLSASLPGTAGALLARAEAHTCRLALIYACADGAHHISPTHLAAALAVWDYAARSAAWALAATTADPLAETLHQLLAATPAGLTRTQIRDHLGRNRPGPAIDDSLAALAANSRAHCQRVEGPGRPAHLWTATPPSS